MGLRAELLAGSETANGTQPEPLANKGRAYAQRMAFERWASRTEPQVFLLHRDGETYRYAATKLAWMAWKAAQETDEIAELLS